jgi:hypothetical protein
MVWEFPAVSQTRKEFWNEPQYNRFYMLIFTVIFGFFGLHHLLLRSPQTAFFCGMVNMLTLGYWWFYDIIQLSTKEYGGLGEEGLNAYGMSSPWGPLGLAQGMWIQPPKIQIPQINTSEQPSTQAKVLSGGGGAMGKAAKEFMNNFMKVVIDWMMSTRPVIPKLMDTTSKDPWFFFFYSLFLPTGILSALFAGDKTNAGFRLLLIFAPLILICVIFYDIFVALLFPASVVYDGMSRPFPFNIFNFVDLNGRSPLITCTQENPTDPEALQKLFETYSGLFEQGASLAESGLAYVPLGAAGAVATEAKEVMSAYATMLKNQAALPQGATSITGLTQGNYDQTKGTLLREIQTTTDPIKKAQLQQAYSSINSAKPALPHLPLQGGGKGREEKSYFDLFAAGVMAAVIGGGLFLGASSSLSNVFKRKDDSPPNAGTI